MNVLVINAGSSSLKYQLLNPETGVLLAKGLCERIGLDGRFTYKPQLPGRAIRDAEKLAMPTHAEAISEVLRALADPENGVVSSMDEIGAVGHRVVHGGESFAVRPDRRGRAARGGGMYAARPAAQPCEYHGHSRLPRSAGGERSAGRRVRYGLPPDHARARVPLQYPLRLL